MYVCVSQFGKQTDGNYTAQRVLVEPAYGQQPLKELQTQVSTVDKVASTLCPAAKDALACLPRGLSPEKPLLDYPSVFRSSSNDERDADRALDDVSEHESNSCTFACSPRNDSSLVRPCLEESTFYCFFRCDCHRPMTHGMSFSSRLPVRAKPSRASSRRRARRTNVRSRRDVRRRRRRSSTSVERDSNSNSRSTARAASARMSAIDRRLAASAN